MFQKIISNEFSGLDVLIIYVAGIFSCMLVRPLEYHKDVLGCGSEIVDGLTAPGGTDLVILV